MVIVYIFAQRTAEPVKLRPVICGRIGGVFPMRFQHILFPVDFSPQSEQAVPAVLEMMNRFKSRLTLLHSVEIYPSGGLDPLLMEDLIGFDDLRSRQESLLEKFRAAQFHSPGVEMVLAKGDPARAIKSCSERENVDLIMMPTHGYGPFRGVLLGSVTAKVIHDALCPVWTSVHAERLHNPTYPCRLIVCAIDSLEDSVATIRSAGALATALESSLVLTHAIPHSARATEIEVRSRLEDMQACADLSVPICIESGDIASVVASTAKRYGADLLMIGRGRSSDRFGSLRSHVFKIIRESSCPVLTV